MTGAPVHPGEILADELEALSFPPQGSRRFTISTLPRKYRYLRPEAARDAADQAHKRDQRSEQQNNLPSSQSFEEGKVYGL
jgi:hypothetical protein